MSDERIHQCLDGTLPREALDLHERQRLEALEATIHEAASGMRSAAVPDLSTGVMERLRAMPVPPTSLPAAEGLLARLARWLWSPVMVPLRPAYAMGAFAVIAAAALLPAQLSPRAGMAPVAAAPEEEPQMYVQFRIEVPGASQVAVAGTFTGWRPEHELTEVSAGVWSAMVPLDPGVHDYTFVIDGERMVVDPYAPQVADSFGGSNSRLFLPTPTGSA